MKRKRNASTKPAPPAKKPKTETGKGYTPDNPMRLYADGVFDCYHFAHSRMFKQCKEKFPYVYLIAGVASDEETTRIKGKLVMNEFERAESVRHCKWVDEVILPCPWTVTVEFLDKHNIDFICHDDLPYGFGGADPADDIYAPLKKAGRFLATERTEGFSTSDLITRIVRDYDDYIRRSLSRGFTRKDLNISLWRKARIEMKGKISSLKRKFSRNMEELQHFFSKNPSEAIDGEPEEKSEEDLGSDFDEEDFQSPFSEKVDKVRETFRDTLERWSDNSTSVVRGFIQRFEKGSEKVENMVHKAFNFKSL